MTIRPWSEVVRVVASQVTTLGIGAPALPDTFPVDTTLDARLMARSQQLAAELDAGSNLPHNPALVEPLLGDVGSLLDRCLAYHREASELEIRFVATQLEASVAESLANVDEELAVRILDRAAVQETESGQADAATRFAAVTGSFEPIAAAFGAAATGASASARQSLANADERERLTHERFVLLRDYREALAARHAAPGGAHNFLERYARVTALLLDDFEDAFRKARCAAIGLESIFRISRETIAFPDLAAPSRQGPIFTLVLWTRRMMRILEVMAESELDFEVVLPIVQPYRAESVTIEPFPGEPFPPPFPPGPPSPFPPQPITVTRIEPFVSASEFGEAMKSIADGGTGRMTFSLPFLFAQNHRRARVVGVGLSFVVSDPALPRLLNYRLSATLVPPAQFFAGGKRRQPPPIVFGSVAPYSLQIATSYVEGVAIHNLQPDGEWSLLVHRYFTTGQTAIQERNERDIVDFKICFKVVSEPTPSFGLGRETEGPV